MTIVYIALGSNLGNRIENLEQARNQMQKAMVIICESSIYETPPLGVTEQPKFLNQVIEAETSMTADELLTFLKYIEQDMGRVKSARFGPRLIDLDILLYGDEVIHSQNLQIPHPRMAERAFVLVPLAEIAPVLKMAKGQLSITEMLTSLDQNGIVKVGGSDQLGLDKEAEK